MVIKPKRISKFPGVIVVALFFYLFPVVHAFANEPHEIISRKNLFSPERKEYKEPKPKKKKKPRKKKPRKKYWPVLCGTIIKGNGAIAIIKFRPVKKSGKRRKRGKWQQGTFVVGDSIGDFDLVEIKKKRMVLDFYGEEIVRYLH